MVAAGGLEGGGAITSMVGAGSASSSVSAGDICRICHCESEPKDPLLAPCYCSGSLKYVHASCLQQWLRASETRSCELCKFSFIMHSKIKPFNEWRSLEMSGVERRRLCCAVLFHCVAALCVLWSLFVLIERALEEVNRGLLGWPFWTKLGVVGVGVTGGGVFMYLQCRQYLALCSRWRAHNRVLLIHNAPSSIHQPHDDDGGFEGCRRAPHAVYHIPRPPATPPLGVPIPPNNIIPCQALNVAPPSHLGPLAGNQPALGPLNPPKILAQPMLNQQAFASHPLASSQPILASKSSLTSQKSQQSIMSRQDSQISPQSLVSPQLSMISPQQCIASPQLSIDSAQQITVSAQHPLVPNTQTLAASQKAFIPQSPMSPVQPLSASRENLLRAPNVS